jgi:hypothetical protein
MAAYLVISHHGRDVCCWHLADNPVAPAFVRYWGHSGQRRTLARDGLSAFDPKRTFGPRSPKRAPGIDHGRQSRELNSRSLETLSRRP